MKTKLIEQYIQFSINNGYNTKNFSNTFIEIDTLIDYITYKQAIAIRDGTLDLFIKKILGTN